MKHEYSNRPWIIGGIAVAILSVYIWRLFVLQIVETKFHESASNNVLRFIVQYPTRGLIYDRNNRLLVYNEPVYDVMVIPRQVKKFDTTELCQILHIDVDYVKKQLAAAKKYSRFKPSAFLNQISITENALFSEKSYKFPGFYTQTRTIRKYPEHNSAHLLGYVGEVNDQIIKQDTSYKSGDYMGINGLERAYESILKGEKGVEIYVVDVYNRIKGRFKNGKLDKKAIPGQDIQISIDTRIQNYGEQLMQNKTGAIIAIEPSSGEILCMVSSPSFDPNLLSGRQRSNNYKALELDSLKPLFNRAMQAQYPPGSTFKLINALVGQQVGVLHSHTTYSCYGGYTVGNFHLGCHHHPSPLRLVESIAMSCNAYYCHVFRNILDHQGATNFRKNYAIWYSAVRSFNLGDKLGIDFPFELPGLIPDTSFYDRRFKNKRWVSINIVSNSIGQGEILLTPLQMVNMTCAIANRGYYYIPHFIRKIENQSQIDPKFTTPVYTKIDPKYFELVIEGMYQAVNGGAGSTARIARVDGLEICGKTGTAQNPHGKDHSIFIAFAPKNNPKIAIAVYVENAGFGATWSAPIASLMIEKYLNDSINPNRKFIEDRILQANLINATQTKN
ncbi:MAG TPA: penicillin-binding protein 2 [Salinivirgaceae bacterium]|nr:penicillin-binding protein 2 [Salinivirgaceae bacterium]